MDTMQMDSSSPKKIMYGVHISSFRRGDVFNKKSFFILCAFLSIAAFIGFIFLNDAPNAKKNFPSLISQEAIPVSSDTITIIGVGDMMLGTLFPSGYLPPNDGRDLLTPVKEILRNADLTFGNEEGGFLD